MHKRGFSSISAIVTIMILIVIVAAAYYLFVSVPVDEGLQSAQSGGVGPVSEPSTSSLSDGLTMIKAPKGLIRATVASTTEDEEKGLGGRDSMPEDQGMLFVFDNPGIYSFWMKDMQFSLDMVWIGQDKKVVGIASDISPSTYPDVFMADSAILYVLELNSGAAERFGISTGTKLEF